MCQDCWKEAGSPQVDNEQVRQAASLVEELYEFTPVGGPWHIVTDDWNTEDRHVAFCVGEIEDGRHAEMAGRGKEISQLLGQLLPAMSEEERVSALALERGFWAPSSAA
jgi:hypothetical protein